MPRWQTGWRKFVAELLAAHYAHRLRAAERIARCGLAAVE
jgi:hypothetical protein